MINLFNLHAIGIVWIAYLFGVICSYYMGRSIRRNNNKGKDYHYGHVFGNFILAPLSWVSFVIYAIMWLCDSDYRSRTDPPSWL
jgi:hypothetical protein